MSFISSYNTHHAYRFNKTLKFIKDVLPAPKIILDLGEKNPFSEVLVENGYTVINTGGEDLDSDLKFVKSQEVEVVTALEIIEHLVAPFNLLKAINSDHLIATVPLRLWFSTAYKSKTDPWDRHFHEFEDWQFDWLLDKAGWRIIKREKWISPTKKIGIRPILRNFTPRHYAVYAVKKNS